MKTHPSPNPMPVPQPHPPWPQPRLWLAILAVLTIILSLVPAPAYASVPVVYVEDHTGAAWPVYYSQGWLDQYTASDMRYGACRTGYKCIKVYERTINSAWAAVTYGFGTSRVTIYVNPQRRYYSWYVRRNIVTHELGHANGIGGHSSYCTDVMYSRVFCSTGSAAPYRFSTYHRSILARN